MIQILLDKDGKAIFKDGKVISLNEPTPSIPTTLGSRIDDKATVVGVLQDHEGNDYVLAVVDAAYRSGSAMAWGSYGVDTPLQNGYGSTNRYTGKYNTDLILSTYSYKAFNFARNACTVTIGSNTYYSVLPSINELQMLYNNKNVLDQYDPTVSEYNDRSMSTFKCGGWSGLWSSNERNADFAYFINSGNGNIGNVYKTNNSNYGVCPVICIPLS